MIEEIDRILLETLFGEEGRYGISYPDDDESVFPDGTASVFCTNWAGYVLRVLGERCSLHGFSVDDNPGSAIAVSSGGHDFALVDGRWIVDGWVKNVECMADHSVFDLEDPAEAAEIAISGSHSSPSSPPSRRNRRPHANVRWRARTSGRHPRCFPEPHPQIRGLPSPDRWSIREGDFAEAGVDESPKNDERGSWAPDEAGRTVWQGLTVWTDTFGTTEVDYLLGRPNRFRGGRLPDGTPVREAETFNARDHEFWRRPSGHGTFIFGTIEILPDGVVFTDDPTLDERFRPSPFVDPSTELQRDMTKDLEFMIRIDDQAFADAVYASFNNRDWRRTDGERHSLSMRRSAAMVALLRQRGESYLDWYPYRGDCDPEVLADVEHIYARHGWTELTREEAVVDHTAAKLLLDEIETRPQGDPQPTPERWRRPDHDTAQDPFSRLHRAKETGRVGEAEYMRISERLLFEKPAEIDDDQHL
jgi:hypothetical protein